MLILASRIKCVKSWCQPCLPSVGTQICSLRQAQTCPRLGDVAFVNGLGPSDAGVRHGHDSWASLWIVHTLHPTAPSSFVGSCFSSSIHFNCISYSFSQFCFLDFQGLCFFFFPTEHGRLNRLLWASLGTLFPVKKCILCWKQTTYTEKRGEHHLFVEWGLPVQPHVSEWKPPRVLFWNLVSPFFFFNVSIWVGKLWVWPHVGDPKR